MYDKEEGVTEEFSRSFHDAGSKKHDPRSKVYPQVCHRPAFKIDHCSIDTTGIGRKHQLKWETFAKNIITENRNEATVSTEELELED